MLSKSQPSNVSSKACPLTHNLTPPPQKKIMATTDLPVNTIQKDADNSKSPATIITILDYIFNLIFLFATKCICYCMYINKG